MLIEQLWYLSKMESYFSQDICQMCACAQSTINKHEEKDEKDAIQRRATSSKLIFGGLQQYLNNRKKVQHQPKTDTFFSEDNAVYLNKETVPEEKQMQGILIVKEVDSLSNSSRSTTITLLPDCVTLCIFAHLPAVDLCRVSSVCKAWEELSNDELLWKKKLQEDMPKWIQMSNTTNPFSYMNHPGWSSKEIYLKCSPDLIKMQQREFNDVSTFTKFIRHLITRNIPKLAMFGPGLECDTSSIVRRIFWDVTNNFKAVGLVPGNAGVGSGMTIKFKNDRNFHLLTLYSNTKRVRRNANEEERVAKSRLYSGNASAANFQVHDCIKDVCRQVEGFVYVINSQDSHRDKLELARNELHAMVDDRWSNSNAPLLILSCVPNAAYSHIPCIEVVRELGLGHFHRPWKVFNCDVESIEDVVHSFDWLMEQTLR